MMTTGSAGEIGKECYSKLMRVCRQFTLQELKGLLDTRNDCFPPVVKSSKIEKAIMINRLEANKVNYLKVLEEVLPKCKITSADYTTYLQNLAFQDVIQHQKKIWQTVQLVEPHNATLKPTQDQIRANILRNIKVKHQANAIVQVEQVDSVFWCLLVLVKYNRRGVATYGNPSYFTYTADQTVLCVCTNKFSAIIDVLVDSFGYSSYKRCELSGKDVATLHALAANTLSQDIIGRRGSRVDSSSHLSPSRIVLQEVKVNCHTEWKGTEYARKKRKRLHVVRSTLQLQAPNIGHFIQSLINDGIITDPVAPWVTKLGTMRSNVISVNETNEIE